jgi:VIT1/CCC1 family predicted Fe2+/Mn2+ transporter
MADGLTVPFALAAGISGAVASTHIVVTAGFAEIAAGSIAMGLGGYLAAKTDAQHYESEYKREVYETEFMLEKEKAEVREILGDYGIEPEDLKRIVDSMAQKKDKFVDFMMRYELGLEKPDPSRARNSALTIGTSYLIGGFIPLFSYIILDDIGQALQLSIFVTMAALVIFGAAKVR